MSKRHNANRNTGTWNARWKDTCASCRETIEPKTPVEWIAGKIAHKACADAKRLHNREANTTAARNGAHRKARRQGKGKATAREVRAAVELAARNRAAILRGDTYRAGGVPEAPGATRRTPPA